MHRKPGWFAPILAAIACAVGASANAQTAGAYPTKPIRYIVPFPPGGMTDLISRIVAQRLGETIGQQVIIDNRSGAGGLVGTELAARAPADGYTVALGFLGTFAIAPHVYSRVPYDPRKDFTPVVELAESAYLVAVNLSTPAASMAELIALARSRGSLNYSTPGNGTPGHLASELLKNMTGVKLTHVPYKGSGPGLAAVIAGETQLIIDPIASALPHVKAGKLRALAVTSNKRVPTLSELPTVTESGVPGYVVTGWYGVVMPAGAPRAIVSKLNADINRVLKQPAVRDPLTAQAVELTGGEPAVFARRIETEFTKWAKVVKDSGAKVD
jgi:tripartite-type tricarboxylate transporter receptor subunit TctC